MRTPSLFLVLSLLAPAGAARAEDVAVGASGSPPGGVGVGLAIGHPSALVVKAGLGERLAIQGGVGTGTLGGDGLHLHVDVLYTLMMLGSSGSMTMPFYVGGGVRYYDHEHDRTDRFEVGQDQHLGVRVPVGLAAELTSVPIDLFAEIALVFDVSVENACPQCEDDAQITALGMVGARYWFGR